MGWDILELSTLPFYDLFAAVEYRRSLLDDKFVQMFGSGAHWKIQCLNCLLRVRNPDNMSINIYFTGVKRANLY